MIPPLIIQDGTIDLSKYNQPKGDILLSSRTFKTLEFLSENKGKVTPAGKNKSKIIVFKMVSHTCLCLGLSFFQSDWDSSLTEYFHNVLNMKEPKYEYDFPPHYTEPWLERNPRE